MKTYKETVETKEVKTVKLISKTCDMCGFAAAREDHWDDSSRYNINNTNVDVRVKCEQGNGWPEGGSKTVYSIDLCPKCFKKELIPWLESKGVAVTEKDVDW